MAWDVSAGREAGERRVCGWGQQIGRTVDKRMDVSVVSRLETSKHPLQFHSQHATSGTQPDEMMVGVLGTEANQHSADKHDVLVAWLP